MSGSLDGLDPKFAAAIQALIDASDGRLFIESGYRSNEEQSRLYDEAVKKYGPDGARKWVAPPGHSNHNKGVAVDLGGDTALAHDLAPRFGLVFPMSWEPWHIEPVGARDGATHDAYTDPPPGQRNPKDDQSLAQQPEFQAAALSDALRGLLDPTDGGMVAGGGTTSTNGQTTSGSSPSVGTSTEGTVDPKELYAKLRAEGIPAEASAALVAIAGRESGFRPDAYNGDKSTGDDSLGLFQVNLLNGGWTDVLEQHGLANPRESLRTLDGSVKAAKILYDTSGLTPWGGYKGEKWNHGGADINVGVDASNGEVTADQLEALQ